MNDFVYELDKLFPDGSVMIRRKLPKDVKPLQGDARAVWMSRKQIEFCHSTIKTKVMVAGRGFGKSAMLSLQFIIWMLELPRAKSYLAAINLMQVKNETVSVIRDLWRAMGFVEGRDFIVGKDPVRHWGKKFKEAWYPPEDYENCITFRNGFTIVMLSSLQIKSKRGGNYDCGVIDEAGFVDEKVFDQVLSKATRANAFRYKSAYHHQKVIVTSRPRDVKGQWVSDMEAKQEAAPDKVLYREASARDNPYLTKEWFDNELATSGYLEFLIEVENEKVDRLPDGFYHQFDDVRHVYSPQYQYINGVKYPNDYNPNSLLDLSFDFGGYFSCCSAFQGKDRIEFLQKQFYVEVNERINQLVDKICDYYSEHNMKFVRLWGEPRGRDKNVTSLKDVYEQMAERFQARGWSVKICTPKGIMTALQKDRYEYINNVLAEDNPLLPRLRVNGSEAKDIIIALKICDRKSNFQKNKAAEDNKKSPQLHAPHFTDTVDYYFEQKYGLKVGRGSRRGKRAG